MCIIMYAPSKVKISEENLRNAFEYNSDGAGVMYYDREGNVHYKKGFNKFSKLWNFFDSLDDSLPRAVHCRIATSGKVATKTCHPFPITDKVEDMGEAEGVSKYGCLMHNGIFSKYTPDKGMMCDYSDSMYYTAKVIYPLRDIIMNEGVLRLLQDMTSRVLLFLPKFKILKFGSWEQDSEEKFYASNDTYEERYKYYYGAYGAWGDYAACYPYTSGATKANGKGLTALSDKKYYSSSTGNTYIQNGNTIIPVHSSYEVKKKEGRFMYSIIINAYRYTDAEADMYEFLEDFYDCITDEDMPYDTLQEIDTNMWEFCVETDKEIDKLVKFPYTVSYMYVLNEGE